VATFRAAVTAVQPIEGLEVGDRVVDNSWSWEHRTDGGYHGTGEIKPVTWIVVAKNHYGPISGVTLLTEELIARYPFDTATELNTDSPIDYLRGTNVWREAGCITPLIQACAPG